MKGRCWRQCDPQDPVLDMHKRAAIAAAIGISTRQVTNCLRDDRLHNVPRCRAPLLANVDHGRRMTSALLSRGLVEGLLPGASTAESRAGSQMTLPKPSLLRATL